DGSEGAALFAQDSRWGHRGYNGGYSLTRVIVDGQPVAPKIDDTMMRLDLPTPLPPHGGKLTIAIAYAFNVPEHGADRMGRDGTLYEIAQWYPRMAVYDDIRGWNVDQYLGQGEFYLEYGDIDYAITVPAGYTVAGSGVLENGAQVLSAKERARLAKASKASDVIAIITDSEAVAKQTPGTKTWRFKADKVRDVAWAAAPDFRWDATSVNGVLCQAYYQIAKANKAWESAAEETQWTIRQYSELVYPYPYPQATSVAGPVGGMEYPMFVMVHYGSDDPSSIFGVINHEHGHEWFPMIVGSNERRYAWMDEGFNTYLNAFANDARYPGTSAYTGDLASWKSAVDRHIQSPLMAAPDHIDAAALGAMGYSKPGAVLLVLRDNVVGRATMDRAMREYVHRWAFKHPTPGDWFRTIENVSGQDLSWFWRGFFYSTDVLDIGIDNVVNSEGTAVVTLSKNTSILFPVSLRLALADGSTQDVHLPVDIWSRGNVFKATVTVKSAVTGARLWPDGVVPDWNPANDTWGTPPAAADLTAKGRGPTSGGLNAPSVQ
ncbi:MAG TPA: M1 family metallopeptidase, partial [Gemmatimonadaceae bacterium]|nr:M1 family metallopeptidase [Gemmatimonadaceae bacterium]